MSVQHRVWLWLVAGLLFAGAQPGAWSAETQPLLFLGDKDYPPLTYLDQGTAQGLEVEVAAELAKRLGRPIRVELLDWKVAQDRVLAGQADGLLGLTMTEERKALYDFSQPVFTHEFSLFVRTQGPLVIRTADLAGHKVGVTPGGLPRSLLRNQPGVDLVLVKDYRDGFAQLAAGRLDVMAADRWVGAYTIQSQALPGIMVAPVPFARMPAAFAVRPGHAQLIGELNGAIAALREAGTLARIQERWRPQEVVFVSRGKLRTFLLVAGGIVGVVLVGSLTAWLVSLKRHLRSQRQSAAALRESEERYRALAESAPNGMVVWVEDKCVYANPAAAAMVGAKAPTELVGRSIWDFIGEASRDLVEQRRRAMLESGQPAPVIPAQIRRLDGTLLEVEGGGAPVVFDGARAIQNTFLDVTERKQAEKKLARQVAFDGLVNRLLAGFASATAAELDHQIGASLQELGAFIGVDLAALIQISAGAERWSVTHEWVRDERFSFKQRYQDAPFGTLAWAERRLQAGETVPIHQLEDFPAEAARDRELHASLGIQSSLRVPVRGRGGLVKGWLSLHAFTRQVAWAEEEIRWLKILSDAIANALERKMVEESLRDSERRFRTLSAQLRALSARLQSLREEERTHIAREIHDHLGQLLTALKFDLRSLERKSAEHTSAELREGLQAKISSARALADEMITSVQKIASELRPGLLDRLGLAAAMEAELQQFTARTSIRCVWTPPTSLEELGQAVSTAAFRIFQEVLTNVARHAHATEVVVRLSHQGGLLVLEISDNGVGLQPGELENPKSLGLLGMQERAGMLGGTVAFGPAAGSGTLVTVHLPTVQNSPVSS